MSDEFAKPKARQQTGDENQINPEIKLVQAADDSRQKIRAALVTYALHLAKSANPPKERIDVNDLLTVLRMCKQAFTADEMFKEVTPELLPLITEKLLPAVAHRQRGPAISALAHLSDHPLWHQKMVILGYAEEVSGPGTFKKYEDFIKAIYAIDEGSWSFDPYYFRELSGRNYSFTTNFECEEDEQVYLRLCARTREFFEEWKRKYMPFAD